MKQASLIVCLLLSALGSRSTFADAKAVITGPEQVETGALVVLDCSESAGGVEKWVIPPKLIGKTLIFGKTLVFATGEPGEYQVGLAVADAVPTVDYTTRTVIVGKPEPTPGPGPGPVPPSPGPAIEKGSWLLFVEESSDRNKYPYLASIQADLAWANRVKSNGLLIGWYDRDATEVKGYRAEAERIGLPALLVISPAGRVIKSTTVPATVEGIEAFIVGGAK